MSSRHPARSREPPSSVPISANYASEGVTFGAGAAIFHLATARVVVCWHSRDRYWFLPKGRKNAGEEGMRTAEREGFEESGYRNRLLPLPIPHRQTYPDPEPISSSKSTPSNLKPKYPFDTEPLWTQLMPVGRNAQYFLFWYAAETLPEEDEYPSTLPPPPSPSASGIQSAGQPAARISAPYRSPPSFPKHLTLKARIALDTRTLSTGEKTVYEPIRHENTGVDEEELMYQSYLLPIAEAQKRLGSSVQADVVRRGWEGVRLRMEVEEMEGLEEV